MYSINIKWSDKDEGYIATIPEFPNLSAFGKTEENALQEAKAALHDFIEIAEQNGIKLPEPSKVNEYSGQIRVRMPRYIHKMLAEEAEQQNISLNSFIITLLSLNYVAFKDSLKRDDEICERINQIIIKTNSQNISLGYTATSSIETSNNMGVIPC